MQARALMDAAKQTFGAASALAAIKSIEDRVKVLDAKMPQQITGRQMLVRAFNIQLKHDQSAGKVVQSKMSRLIVVQHG